MPKKDKKGNAETTDTEAEESAGPSTQASKQSTKAAKDAEKKASKASKSADKKGDKAKKDADKDAEKAKKDAEKKEAKEKKDAEDKAKKEQKEQDKKDKKPKKEKKPKKPSAKKKDKKGKGKKEVYINVPDTSENTDMEMEDFGDGNEDDEELYEMIKNQDKTGVSKYIEEKYMTAPKASQINFFSKKENADALTLAVKTGNVGIVDEILMVKDIIQTRNALLSAIKEESMEMIQKILEYHNNDTKKAASIIPSVVRKRSSTAVDLVTTSEFDDYVTPIMLAATTGNYNIIEYFFNKGDRIESPHSPTCTCDTCKSTNTNMHKAYQRLYVLEAMTNPHYLALLAGDIEPKDPVDECFSAIDKIQNFMSLEPEFNEGYQALKDKVEKFNVDMLGLCNTDAEVQLFMGKQSNKDIVHHHAGNTAVEQNYPRLVTAITTSSKKFVSHPHSQEILHQLWKIDSMLGLSYDNPVHRLIIIILIGGLWPVWCLYSMFDPHILHTQFGKPQARCIFSAGSHIFFLFLLATLHSDALSLADRGTTHIYLKILIGFFVLNYIVQMLAHFVLANFRGVPFTGWDYFELVHLVAFIITFVFWIMAATQEAKTVTRDRWQWDEPILLGEASMSIATTMAFLKILKLFMLHRVLGPLQTSYGKMIRVAFTFFVFFGIVNVAASLGLYYIYRPYKNFKEYDDKGEEVTQDSTWVSLSSASYSLFWLTFAGVGPESTIVMRMQEKCHNASMPECSDGVKAYNHHEFTQSAGNLIYCCYLFLCCTIMLNMIIAVIGKTYEKVLSNVEVEWKFSRSEVWMGYMKEKLSPPPFTIFSVVFALIGGVISSSKQKKMDIETGGGKRANYSLLIKNLLQRHVRKVSKEASEDKPTKQHVANAKENIKDLTRRMKHFNTPGPSEEK